MEGKLTAGAGLRPLLGALQRVLRPASICLLAAAALVGTYLLLVTLAQGPRHALDLLRQDLWFVGPVAAGFGLQVSLLWQLRWQRRTLATGAAVTAGSTGLSSGAMLACCAHHVTDILPLIGASGAAVFLIEVKTPLALAGVALSWAGVAYLLFRLKRNERARAC